MSAILTLERIAEENKLAEGLDLPGFWHMKNLFFLEAILSMIEEKPEIDLPEMIMKLHKNIFKNSYNLEDDFNDFAYAYRRSNYNW